ncbi:MAG: hypothetical protein AAGA62_15130, partial [Bacteroidota bacterium]
MQYLHNSALSFHPQAPSGWQGNPFAAPEFKYDRDPFRPDWSALLKMIFSRNPQHKEKKADDWTPSVAPDTQYLEDRSR